MGNSYENIYIVTALRTPVGKAPHGFFSKTRPDDLLIAAMQALFKQSPHLDPATIDDVIIGCAMPEAEQGMNIARNALLLAGLPESVPGMTINRFCASGLQAIASAVERIASGQANAIIAGGVESMSMIPMGGHRLAINPKVFKDNKHLAIAYGMGITAEIVAKHYDISREDQEAFALQSHQRAILAQEEHLFDEEIVPVTLTQQSIDLAKAAINTENQTIKYDEGPRRDTSIDKMALLPAAFYRQGSITAATSSQMSDGAAVCLVVNDAYLKAHQLTPMARLLSFALAGVPPEMMGIGPVYAIPKALKTANLKIDDLEWIELNEAFAAQVLAVIRQCELNVERVNPLGGAIALGHPLGATGAIRTATLLHGMNRRQMRYGMVTMCVGTGMGAAGIFERVS
jgi:acetyl-CoA acyltransferase